MKGLRGAATLRRACCELQYLSDLDRLIETVFETQHRADSEEAGAGVPFP
jgi:tRNA-dihydrouridine synthase B